MIDASPRAVATNPEWLPRGFDPEGRLLSSVRVPRSEHGKLTFVNDQYFQNRYPGAVHERSAIEAALTEAPHGPLHFIFHSAFCCSTLLVKALDLPGVATGLAEPGILTEFRFRFEAGTPGSDDLLALTLRLLSRPFGSDRMVIVKPSNTVNPLIKPILEKSPGSRAILMYSDVRTFLLAIVKYGLGRRIWARQLFADLAKQSSLVRVDDPDAMLEKSDLQLAGLAWLLQVHHFVRLARECGNERVMLLDSDRILRQPADAIASVSDFFGMGLDARTAAGIAAGPAFSSHSKIVGTDYSVAKRDEDQAKLEQAYGAEVDEAASWLRAAASKLNAELPDGAL